MLLYSSQITPRLSYIAQFFGKELFSQDIEITTDKNQFQHYEGPKINYSPAPLGPGECWIANANLLFEEGIRDQPIQCFDNIGHKAFFKTEGSDFPFDIFAASFYLISRYEEYLPHEKDAYGRYAHFNSLASKEKFLHLPLVNIWIEDFRKLLIQKYPGIEFSKKAFTFIPTYDIDIAYSYKHKGWVRNLGGLLRSALKVDLKPLVERMSVMLRVKEDPFDCYETLDDLHRMFRMDPYYFFLVAKEQAGFDKNISPATTAMHQLIKQHSLIYTIGIHPSWKSGDRPGLLKDEIEWLQQVTGKTIIHSRQHYIRFSLPGTYRELVKAGIQKEYSMGYGTTNGFRASVASSFNWYDLQKEESTNLVIYPFCFMDSNAFYQQKLSVIDAYKELEFYYYSIKNVHGLMITIWHNQFLGTDPAFEGWREMHERFISFSGNNEN